MASQAATISLSHHESLQRLSITAAGTDASQKISVAGPVDMRFDALGRSFELQLAPNSRLLGVARSIPGNTATPYLGKLAGTEDSWVRIVIAGGQPSGLIWDGSELFAIERAGENIAGTDAAIIFRLSDAVIAPGSMTCGSGDSLTNAGDVYKTLASELQAATAQAEGATKEISVGAVGDAEFAAIHGTNSQQAILDRLSNVDGIFSSQVGVQISVPLVQVFTDPGSSSYPFSATVNAGDLLDELATYRDSEPNQNVNGLTHLWTGKNVESNTGNDTTVGIAFAGALCQQRFGAVEGQD